MELPDPEAERREMRLTDGVTGTPSRSRWKGAVPPVGHEEDFERPAGRRQVDL